MLMPNGTHIPVVKVGNKSFWSIRPLLNSGLEKEVLQCTQYLQNTDEDGNVLNMVDMDDENVRVEEQFIEHIRAGHYGTYQGCETCRVGKQKCIRHPIDTRPIDVGQLVMLDALGGPLVQSKYFKRNC